MFGKKGGPIGGLLDFLYSSSRGQKLWMVKRDLQAVELENTCPLYISPPRRKIKIPNPCTMGSDAFNLEREQYVQNSSAINLSHMTVEVQK